MAIQLVKHIMSQQLNLTLNVPNKKICPCGAASCKKFFDNLFETVCSLHSNESFVRYLYLATCGISTGCFMPVPEDDIMLTCYSQTHLNG